MTGDVKINAKKFGLDLSKIASGTFISQIILVVLTTVITRIYDPAVYGIASTFAAITNILLVVCCLRYEQAVMLPESDQDSGNLLAGCVIILSVFSIVLIPIILLFGDVLLGFFNLTTLSPYLILIPAIIFVGGIFLSLKFWNLRKKRFGTQATTQVLQYVVYPGSQIGLGLSGFATAGSIIISDIIAKIPCICVYFIQFIKDDCKKILSGLSPKQIKAQLIKYKKFPLFNTWSELLYCLSWQLPVLLLASFFSDAVAGQYSLAYRSLLLPLSLIGGSIGQVLFQRAAVAVHNNTLPELVEEIVSLIITISFLPMLMMAILGADIFSVIFGEQWGLAGLLVQILSIWMIVWFIASPLMNLINVLGIQGFGLKYNILSVVARGGALIIGGLSGNVYVALILFTAISFILDSYIGYSLISKSGSSIRKITGLIVKPCVVSISIFLILFVVYIIINSLFTGLLASILSIGVAGLLGLLYVIYLFKRNPLVCSYLKIWS